MNSFNLSKEKFCKSFCKNKNNMSVFDNNVPFFDEKRMKNFENEKLQHDVVAKLSSDSLLVTLDNQIDDMPKFDSEFQRVDYLHSALKFFASHSELHSEYIDEKNNLLKNWAKVLYFGFASIPNAIDLIDDIVGTRAVSVNSAYGIAVHNETTLRQVEKILDMTERKKQLFRVLSICSTLDFAISQETRSVMRKRFCERWSIPKLAKHFAVCERTINRMIDRALSQCANKLSYCGFEPLQLLSSLKTEPWLLKEF